MRFLKKILKNEEGASMIMVAIALVVIFGFAVVTIDMSLIQLAKTQLQNAADAAALAGAVTMVTTAGSQEEKEAAATAEAIRIGSLNVALQDVDQPVMITSDDVTFPQPGLVRVTTGRSGRVATYFLRVLDPLLPEDDEITAVATAGSELICGTNCLRPFCPPDRWNDVDSNGIWTPDDEYNDMNANGVWDAGEPLTEDWNGNGVWDPEEEYDPEVTGYKVPDDLGVQIALKYNSPNETSWESGWFYPVRFAPINSGEPLDPGGANYESWIVGDTCEPYIISIGDSLALEQGNMVGPTTHGLDELIAKDPTAQWDEATGTVINSAFPTSPRIVKVAAFDPKRGVQSGPPRHVVVSKIMVLFIEWWYLDSGDRYVVGRFMQMITEGVPDPDCPGGFMTEILLVE